MLRLKEEGIFVSPQTKNSDPFNGIHYGTNVAQDGINLTRKVGIIKVSAIPTDGITLVVGGKTYTFKLTKTLATHIAIANLVTNGNFAASGTGWKYDPNQWTVDGSGALHVAGSRSVPVHRLDANDDTFTENDTVPNTDPLFQEWTPKAIVGYTYATVFIISGRSAGSVQIGIGGVLGTARTADGTYTQSLVAVTDGNLQIVPSADFDGKITSVVVTETHTDLVGLQAKMIADQINLDKATTLCTAYILGKNTLIALVANDVGVTPTITPDGVKVTLDTAFALTISELKLESTDYFKVDNVSDPIAKPTVLVERNAGTDKNFLY